MPIRLLRPLSRAALPCALLLACACGTTAKGNTAGDGPAPGAPALAREWQPAKTRVFVAGLLQWQNSASLTSFDPRNRRDAELVAFFKAQGVPAAQLVYLQDRQATTRAIREALERFLDASAADELLVVYYCGHGYKDDAGKGWFASYDAGAGGEGWAIASIPAVIEKRFKGSRAILAADCCYSGLLAEEAKRQVKRVSYAVFASSSASEVSTGNWTFTEALLDGLRGRAGCDLDGDGAVTADELGRYIAEDMAYGEEQQAAFLACGAFTPGTRLAVAERKTDPLVGRRGEALWQGSYYKARVTAVKGDRCQIHWLGFRDYPDEWTDRALFRLPGARTRAASGFTAGAVVEVQWKGTWYPATVLETKGAVYRIHYTGYDASWDEWVSSKRIRKPGS